jgi:hypothetical protein
VTVLVNEDRSIIADWAALNIPISVFLESIIKKKIA